MMKSGPMQKWRKIGSDYRNGDKYDSELHGPRWYRFEGKLPEMMVEDKSCGTKYPAWLWAGSHPDVDDGIVERVICFGKKCGNPTAIQVAACSMENQFYYVYKLGKTNDNDSGYCWETYDSDQSIQQQQKVQTS